MYSRGFQSVAAAAGAPYCTLHTGGSLRAKIREIGISTNAATVSSVGLVRPTNTPVASTSLLGQGEDPGDPASTVNIDTAWSTAPTVGTLSVSLTVPVASSSVAVPSGVSTMTLPEQDVVASQP